MRRAALLLALILLQDGCGFQLRTWDLEGSVETARINGSNRNPVAEPLRRALRSAGVALVGTDEAADVEIDLLNERRGRRSVSVNSQARAAEYETSLGIQYEIRGKGDEILVSSRWIQASRVFRIERENLVGASEEQALLEREMVTDLVQQVIRSLNAVSRNATGAS